MSGQQWNSGGQTVILSKAKEFICCFNLEVFRLNLLLLSVKNVCFFANHSLHTVSIVLSSNLVVPPHLHVVLCVRCVGQAEEAQDQYRSCIADAGVRRMDLANAKSTILTQIREMVFQCDLTLKAVSSIIN